MSLTPVREIEIEIILEFNQSEERKSILNK